MRYRVTVSCLIDGSLSDARKARSNCLWWLSNGNDGPQPYGVDTEILPVTTVMGEYDAIARDGGVSTD